MRLAFSAELAGLFGRIDLLLGSLVAASLVAGLIGWAAATGPAPLVGVGHSMGGHLWLRLLAGGALYVIL